MGSGRDSVVQTPASLVNSTLLISGHHGFSKALGPRFIVDASGGRPSKYRPIQALVLPDKLFISHADMPAKPATPAHNAHKRVFRMNKAKSKPMNKAKSKPANKAKSKPTNKAAPQKLPSGQSPQ